MTRPHLAAALTAAAALFVLTACSGSGDTAEDPSTGVPGGSGPVTIEHAFGSTEIPEDPQELLLIRGFHDFYDPSGTAALFRNNLIPAFYALFGLFIPENLKAFYVTFR